MKAVKVIALWALLSVTGFLGYVFHWSNIEFAVAWLWAVVIFLIFEVSKLTDASLKTVVDDNAKIAKQIEQGEAVEPKHHPPIRNPSTYPDQERMFQDFAGFANRVNHDLQMTGWRLQE